MDNRFFKKTLIYFLGNFSTKILNAILIPIYAYFVSLEDLGNFDYIAALMNIIIPVVFFNFWDGILKYAITDDSETNLKKLFTSVLIAITINIILFVVGYISIYKLGIIYYPSFKLSIIMMLLYGYVTLLQYSCRAFQENAIYAFSSVLSSFVNILFIIIFVIVMDLGLNGLIFAYIISMASAMILMEWRIHLVHYIDIHYFDFNFLIKIIKFCAPIALNTLSLWGMNGISKIICVNYLSSSANGLFSFASKFGAIITILGSIIGAVIIEEAYLIDDLDEYRKKFSKIINNIFTIYIIILWFAIPVVNILFDVLWINNAYYDSKLIVPFITLGAIFSSVSTNFGSAFQVTNKTIYVFLTSLIGSLCSVVLSFLLIKYGLIGIACGQMVGSFALMISRAMFAYKLTNLSINWESIFLKITIFILIAFFSFKFSLFYNFILLIGLAIIFLALYKRLFFSLVNKFFKWR